MSHESHARVPMSRPLKVGWAQREYANVRNIIGSPSPGVERVRTDNLFRYPTHALYRVANRLDPLLSNLHWGRRDCDLRHFFNMVSLNRTPWVTTFETALPRWIETRDWATNWGMKLLAGKPCRRLIALSDCAAVFQRAVLDDHPDVAAEIEAKITVLHPPQPLLVDAPKPAPLAGEPIRFVLVGSDFFRKGGAEVLRLFDRLLERDAPVELEIVSTLAHGDYATHTTADDLAAAQRLIAKWPDRIRHHVRLSNEAVLDLMRSAHVGLLPTWADTYGYSVLEAQAAGCPVITTDIRALPEINDDRQGWIIPVPRDDRGNGLLGTAEARRRFSEQLEAGLEQAVEAILADPASIVTRGKVALERIAMMHSPQRHGERLREIYDAALA